MKSLWKKILHWVKNNFSIYLIAGLLTWFILQPVFENNIGFENKTLWDRMELLIVPLVLAFGVYYLNKEERKVEREITKDNQQEGALQNYFDRMAELLLEKKLQTTKNKDVREIARIRTLSLLEGLDERRKGLVIIFLHEAGLIHVNNPVVKLGGANLKGANLINVNLEASSLEGVKLQDADLRGANLKSSLLSESVLFGANFSNSNLKDAMLIGAHFGKKDMENNFKGATMPDGTIHD